MLTDEKIAEISKDSPGFKHTRHPDYGDLFINDKNEILIVASHLYAEQLPWDERILECVKNGKQNDPYSWNDIDHIITK